MAAAAAKGTVAAALLENGAIRVLLDLMTYMASADIVREVLWCFASLASVDDRSRNHFLQQETLTGVGRNLMVGCVVSRRFPRSSAVSRGTTHASQHQWSDGC